MSAHSADDPAILARLTRTILGALFGQPPILSPGRVPDGWPADLVPPPPVSTLGGTSHGIALMAVFLYPPGTDSPLAEYRALLEDTGWGPHGLGPDGGFDSMHIAMLRRESSLVTLHRESQDPTDTSLVVSLKVNDTGLPNRGARIPHQRALGVPRLLVPPGVRSDGGGGSSGGSSRSGEHATWHIRVTTELAPHELLPLYAKQLADAGWRTGTLQTSPASAIQWLEATDNQRRVWRGLLTVYVNGSAHDVFIYMATTAA